MNKPNSKPRQRWLMPLAALAALCVAAISGYYAGSVHARQNAIVVKPLLKTTQTIIGQTITYPQNAHPQVTAALITIAPGAQTGWHSHPVPQFAYILEGEIRVDYGDNTIHTYKAGDALIEAIQHPHDGRNVAKVPVRILSVFIGAKGMPDTKATPQPPRP